MILDRPMLGLSLMLGFCLLAPLGDSIAKTLGASIPLGLLVATRFGLQTLLLAPVVALSRRSLKMTRRVLILTMVRTVLHILGIGTMFLALRYLPLADAIAIAFVMPFIMLVLGKTILHETIGIHRLAACGVGFAGTLLVIQPNFASVGAPALLPLGVALVFALFMLVTRQIAKDVDPISMQFVSGLAASAVLIPAILLAPDGWSDLKPILPSARDAVLLGLMGLIGTLAHLLMTWSLRFAPSTTLAPMQYLEIPFATLIGWLVFADLPNGLAAIGIAITVASGLYVIRREQLIQTRPPLSPAPPAAE
jgi:drug/metabolite transporter (DMT)-like permease